MQQPPRQSPTPLGPPPDAEARIRQLEDKLRRYQDAKDEIRSLEAKLRHYGEAKDELLRRYDAAKREVHRLRHENGQLRGELRLQRVPPREGARCQTCGAVKGPASPPREPASPRAAARAPPATRQTRAESSAGDSPRRKALPVAPPSDDDDGGNADDDDDDDDDDEEEAAVEEEELPPLPAAAKPRHLLTQSAPNTNSIPLADNGGGGQRGSVLKALDPAEIRRSIQKAYGEDIMGGEESSADASDSSDAPEPPPRPLSMGKNDSAPVPSLSLHNQPKSPRYASDPMKKAMIPSSDGQRSSSSSSTTNSGSRVGSSDIASLSFSALSSHKDERSSGQQQQRRPFGSLSKGSSLHNIFRRGMVPSHGSTDEASVDESDMYHSSPTEYGMPSPGSSGMTMRKGSEHSLLDPTQAQLWRSQAGGGGGVTLTPINVTTINKTCYYLVRVESPESAWVVPRTFEQLRDFRQNLLFEFPSANVPQPPNKLFKGNVKEKTVGDRLSWLQTFLDALLSDEKLASSVLLLKFLDPFYRPSPLALRAIGPIKEGTLQYRSDKTSGKKFQQMLCILKHDLYVFRSQDDQTPFEVVSLEYCMIDLVSDTAEIPRFAFQITALKDGETFLLAASSSKELADWILLIRDEKTKRITYCRNTEESPRPSTPPATRPQDDAFVERRAPIRRLLNDYVTSAASDKDLRQRCALPAGFVPPPVRSEPESGVSLDVKDNVLAASGPKLLHVVFEPRRTDKSLPLAFLVAFRGFSSPLEVFTYLKEKYMLGGSEVKDRCIFVLQLWFEHHLYDFLDSMLLSQVMIEFLLAHCSANDARSVKEALQRALTQSQPQAPDVSAAPQSVLPQIYRGSAFDFLDFAPLEVARQLTLLHHAALVRIDAFELLPERETPPAPGGGLHHAPHVKQFIADFNQLCSWVSSMIVSTRPAIPRIALIHRWIDVAKCSLDLQNFNATMAILGGLLSTPVHRLKEDWEAIPRDSQDLFGELKAVFATSNNWKMYRAALTHASPPGVPYLGLMLQDLTFLESNKDTKLVGTVSMVNMEKADKVAGVLSELTRFQKTVYTLKPIHSLQHYLRTGIGLTMDEQDILSHQIRPKGKGGETSPRRVVWKKEFSPRREGDHQ